MHEVTQILAALDDNPAAAEQLLPLVYDELRKLAAQKLGEEKPGQTLQATALVHEAYLRLVGPAEPKVYRDRSHFFCAAAQAMRRILIEQARRKQSLKRGGGWARDPLEDITITRADEELLALNEALEGFATSEPLKARLVELRYFAGLTNDQAAEVLGISPTTQTVIGRMLAPGCKPPSAGNDKKTTILIFCGAFKTQIALLEMRFYS